MIRSSFTKTSLMFLKYVTVLEIRMNLCKNIFLDFPVLASVSKCSFRGGGMNLKNGELFFLPTSSFKKISLIF